MAILGLAGAKRNKQIVISIRETKIACVSKKRNELTGLF